MPPYPMLAPDSASFLCLKAFTVGCRLATGERKIITAHLAILGPLVRDQTDHYERDD